MPMLKKEARGFTIVELLIVIVVIAILAAITIVAYNGIQSRARTTSLMADARQAATQVELLKQETGDYPATVTTATIKLSGENSVDYTLHEGRYCLTVGNDQGSAYVSSTQRQPAVGPCPAGHWKMNGNANDSSIYENHGTLMGNPTPTADRHGSSNEAYSFNGSQYINVGNVTQPRANFSVSAWVKSPTNTVGVSGYPGHLQSIIAKGDWNTNGAHWFMGFGGGTNTWLGFNNYSGTWASATAYPISNFNVSAWNHFVGVSTPTQERLYINGQQVSSRDRAYIGTANSYPLHIARSSYVSNSYTGQIDDVRIFNKDLSQAEIRQLYELK